jgi:signal transduction histidine kinase
MGQHVHELLHVAAATLFVLAGVSALFEYRNLRERVVLAYGLMCLFAAAYAGHVVISHGLPKRGEFWIPWTTFVLTITFGATFLYLFTMRAFLGMRGRPFGAALVVQGGLTAIALSDMLLYFATRRSFLFVPIPRENVNESQRQMGEGAYSLLPAAEIVAALWALSFVFGVGYLLVHLLRTRSRETLVYVGLVTNALIIVNDTLIALNVFSGWYLIAFSKAFEIVRIHGDIKARSREGIERRLRQAQKMEAIGRVTSGVAHDFNNVLMAVGGRVELAASLLAPEHPAQQDLDGARQGLETGRRLTRQLLDVARAEEVKPEHVDLADYLPRSTKLFTSMVPNRVALDVAVEPDVGGVMIAEGQLTQVLMNLVVNARDAMPKGGTIKIRARPLSASLRRRPCRRFRPQVQISVIDDGTGMPTEVLEHVFEPFFTTKADSGGTGLGLATLYSIVHKAGGRVEVVSKPGRGSRFDVVLPRCEAKPSASS